MRVHRIVQARLPMDTGNLRYNGTKRYYFGSHGGINIGGIRADYFEFLEESSKSKYKGDLEYKIVPEILTVVDAIANNRGFSEIVSSDFVYKSNIGRNLVRRKARLRASLARSGR